MKLVAGIDNCFVSLPLILIQTLQSSSQSRSALLREVLALELRSRTNDDRWVVAWSGATSSSSAIEVVYLLIFKFFFLCLYFLFHISLILLNVEFWR